MNDSIVKVENLSHRYSSNSWAVKDINFEIKQKGILGLLGSNGAGKSTTMNIICGVLYQTEGEVLINGIDIRKNPVEAKKYIGFLPQKAPLHLDFTVDEYLTNCANLRLVPANKVKSAVEEAKEKCGIAHFSERLIRNLSGGYQQRVGIAQSIIHNPSLVVLDEPTNGLDPNQILSVRKLIKEIAKERAVILSTHILSEVQATCERIKMIEKGRLVFSGTMNDFNDYVEPNSMLINMAAPPTEVEFKAIDGITGADFITDNRIRLFFNDKIGISEKVIERSVAENWHLQEITMERSSLDDIFAKLSKEPVNQ